MMVERQQERRRHCLILWTSKPKMRQMF